MNAVRRFTAAMSWPEVMGLAVSAVIAVRLITISWALAFPAAVIVGLMLLVVRLEQRIDEVSAQVARAELRAVGLQQELRVERGLAPVVPLRFIR